MRIGHTNEKKPIMPIDISKPLLIRIMLFFTTKSIPLISHLCSIRNYSWKEIENAIISAAIKLNRKNFKPDIIIGIGRGGAIVAGLLSNALEPRSGGLRRPLVISVDYEQHGKSSIIKSLNSNVFTEKRCLIVIGETNTGSALNSVKEYISSFQGVKKIKTLSLILKLENNVPKSKDVDFEILSTHRKICPPWDRLNKHNPT